MTVPHQTRIQIQLEEEALHRRRCNKKPADLIPASEASESSAGGTIALTYLTNAFNNRSPPQGYCGKQ